MILFLFKAFRQQLIDKRLLYANRNRKPYDYSIGDQVMKVRKSKYKLQPIAEGPFTVAQVHTNGNVTLQLSPHVTERINIRRVRPYRT